MYPKNPKHCLKIQACGLLVAVLVAPAGAFANPVVMPLCKDLDPQGAVHPRPMLIQLNGSQYYSVAYLNDKKLCEENLKDRQDQGACSKAVAKVARRLNAHLVALRAACQAEREDQRCRATAAPGLAQEACLAAAHRVLAPNANVAAFELRGFLTESAALERELNGAQSRLASGTALAQEISHALEATKRSSAYAKGSASGLEAWAQSSRINAGYYGKRAPLSGSVDDDGRRYRRWDDYPYQAQVAPPPPAGGASSGSGNGGGGAGAGTDMSAASRPFDLNKLKAEESKLKEKALADAGKKNGKEEIAQGLKFNGELGKGALVPPAAAAAPAAGPAGPSFDKISPITVASVRPSSASAGPRPSFAATQTPQSLGSSGGGSPDSTEKAVTDHKAAVEASSVPLAASDREASTGGSRGARGGGSANNALDSLLEGEVKKKGTGTAATLTSKGLMVPTGSSEEELNQGVAGLVGMNASDLKAAKVQLGSADTGLFARVKQANQRALLRGDIDDSKSVVLEQLNRMAGRP